VEKNGRFLVHQRPAGVVNAHLWEFPNVEIPAAIRPRIPSSSATSVALQLFGAKLASVHHLCTVKHSITRYRITVEAFVAHFRNVQRKKTTGQWRTISELETLAFSSAHRRILTELKTTLKASGLA
jgi:adenine-specific DNA glycosylase